MGESQRLPNYAILGARTF